MPRKITPEDTWYGELSREEASEVHALDEAIGFLESAKAALVKRRGSIRSRASGRYLGRLKTEERKVRWRSTNGKDVPL